MKPWKLLQHDIFCVMVFVILGGNTMALGDCCLMFQDSTVVSSSRVQMSNDWTVTFLDETTTLSQTLAPHSRKTKGLNFTAVKA
jgi:hypothetical protein